MLQFVHRPPYRISLYRQAVDRPTACPHNIRTGFIILRFLIGNLSIMEQRIEERLPEFRLQICFRHIRKIRFHHMADCICYTGCGLPAGHSICEFRIQKRCPRTHIRTGISCLHINIHTADHGTC